MQRHFPARWQPDRAQNVSKHAPVEPYIAFVLLLEGSLDFGINRERYRIEAEGGHVLLIACDEEILFSRYLYEGGHTAKLTLKGIDRWLARPQYAGLLQAVYREKV